MNAVRIGHGFDVHAFTEGDGFVLGGVRIAADKALLAHSDGDVLIHALCDALLGAIGQRDIGQLYPDNDPQNANRDSREFLREVERQIGLGGYCLGNADRAFPWEGMNAFNLSVVPQRATWHGIGDFSLL